ncbi:MAG: hypothetical protein QF449_11525 [Alphaproteobacteria bacterium]|jgi:hypothetical protein|nr:hypothetical protein [Alphaproteobacteria bacterium]MDP6644380.1 hypothetical protein [Rhodospirillales bacterium]MDP6818655.1 hypothetical protein [Alphaproteobacteria bacterium]|tara:strand:- start:591 stop:1043 length:453 start_codon:yes stop_codon:yes gene_type:complete
MLRAIDAIGEPHTPIELNSLEVDNSGIISQRAPKFPLSFSFIWRECKFEGCVDQKGGRLTLELDLKLGDVPYTAQDSERRGKWSAMISKTEHPESGTLQIIRDSSAVLSKTIDLPEMNGFTADGFVTNTALMVLSLAPYLDLIAEVNGEA